jgi:hypothetical protein
VRQEKYAAIVIIVVEIITYEPIYLELNYLSKSRRSLVGDKEA